MWEDLCVVDVFKGPTLPCNWLGFDRGNKSGLSYAWLLGKPKGELVGRDSGEYPEHVPLDFD